MSQPIRITDTRPSFFISDLHIKEDKDQAAELFMNFLSCHQEIRLYIVGDLFDVWPGTRPYMVEKFKNVLGSMKEFIRRGSEIIYIEGNHDFRLGIFFKEEIGCCVFEKDCQVQFGDRMMMLTHGHLINRNDVVNTCFHSFLRHPRLHWLLDSCLTGRGVYAVGSLASSLSRNLGRRKEKIGSALHTSSYELKIRDAYRSFASNFFSHGFDIVITGHTHIPDVYEVPFGSKKKIYLNTGDWVTHFSYIEFDGSNFVHKSISF